MQLPFSQNILCPYFPKCSGCLINQNANIPPVLEDVGRFFNEQGVSCAYYSDQVTEWRYRAKLAVRGDVHNPLIGLYEAGTHQIVNIPECRVHHPLINKAVELLKEWIVETKIVPYNESTQEGVLRYVQCVIERSSNSIQLSLVINASSDSSCFLDVEALWNKDPLVWQSIWFNFNKTHTNLIFGNQWSLKKGRRYLIEDLAGAKVCFHPANFAQANLTVFEKLLQDLKKEIKPHSKIVEYYAGVGVIGFSLAENAKTVVCNEINPYAEDAFYESLKGMNLTNVKFVSGSVSEHLNLLKDCDVVIVDPPRKGLDKPLLEALNKNSAKKELWYMSCGWSSFKKDCLALKAQWSLIQARAYLFFPGTDHVEILAKFETR